MLIVPETDTQHKGSCFTSKLATNFNSVQGFGSDVNKATHVKAKAMAMAFKAKAAASKAKA